MLDNMSDFDLDPELCECTRLITNNFVIDSAGISPATRQRAQQSRGLARRRNIAPQQVNFDLKFDSPEKLNTFTEDLSFYSSNNVASSPRPCPISPCRDDDSSLLSPESSPSMFSIVKIQLPRQNSQDSTSMDSGYSGLQTDTSNTRLGTLSSTSASAFRFIEPKRPETSSPPAVKTPSKYSSSSLSSIGSAGKHTGFTVFHSLSTGSVGSADDEYMELMDMESMDDDAQMPTDLCSLISKDIKNSTRTPDHKRPESYVRKCLNMDGGGVRNIFNSPKTSTVTSLITTPERRFLHKISENVTPFRNITGGAFKRPEPPAMSPIQSKRYKCENEPPMTADSVKFSHPPQFPQKRPVLRKSMSMNDAAAINDALDRSSSDSNLIGDYSRSYCLPLIEGNHSSRDLKSITSDTLSKLLKGEFNDRVASFKVIDCRYPYEFEGGHITGALNLFTHEQILEQFANKKTDTGADTVKRDILVFHCEFSSERGPKLSRFLRNHDRDVLNKDTYPSLHYPEIYLLRGGYKEFFESNSDLCNPMAYRPMLEPSYTDEYRQIRAKTKSWTGDVRASASNRLTKQPSRSRLF